MEQVLVELGHSVIWRESTPGWGYREIISACVKELTLEEPLLMGWRTIAGLSCMNSKKIGSREFCLLSCLPMSLEEPNSMPAGKGANLLNSSSSITKHSIGAGYLDPRDNSLKYPAQYEILIHNKDSISNSHTCPWETCIAGWLKAQILEWDSLDLNFGSVIYCMILGKLCNLSVLPHEGKRFTSQK